MPLGKGPLASEIIPLLEQIHAPNIWFRAGTPCDLQELIESCQFLDAKMSELRDLHRVLEEFIRPAQLIESTPGRGTFAASLSSRGLPSADEILTIFKYETSYIKRYKTECLCSPKNPACFHEILELADELHAFDEIIKLLTDAKIPKLLNLLVSAHKLSVSSQVLEDEQLSALSQWAKAIMDLARFERANVVNVSGEVVAESVICWKYKVYSGAQDAIRKRNEEGPKAYLEAIRGAVLIDFDEALQSLTTNTRDPLDCESYERARILRLKLELAKVDELEQCMARFTKERQDRRSFRTWEKKEFLKFLEEHFD